MHNLARLPYALARTVTRAVARTLTRAPWVALPFRYRPCGQAPKDRACQTSHGELQTIPGVVPVAGSRLSGRTVSTAPLPVVPRVVGLGPARHGRNRTPDRGDSTGCGHGRPGGLGRVRAHRTVDPRAEADRSGMAHGTRDQSRAGGPPTPYRPESRPGAPPRPGQLHRHRTGELGGPTRRGPASPIPRSPGPIPSSPRAGLEPAPPHRTSRGRHHCSLTGRSGLPLPSPGTAQVSVYHRHTGTLIYNFFGSWEGETLQPY
jgi:hypothetical protein